jgi:hypothetical protein
LPCETSIQGETAASRLFDEEIGERSVGRPPLVEASHDVIEPVPEIVGATKTLANDLPASPADVDAGERRLLYDVFDLGCTTMDEFGAELDGDGCRCVPMRQDAAADSLAGFEDDDIEALVVERAGGGEAGRAGSDDGDVNGGRGAFEHGRRWLAYEGCQAAWGIFIPNG